MKNKRVLVALSGGMDSAVAAALLKTQGYEVIGLHIQLWDKASAKALPPGGTCCKYVTAEDVQKICRHLEIPFQLVDAQEQYQNDIVDYFVHEFLQGRVPNPCARCSYVVKIASLIRKADELRCDYVATGHYAKVVRNPQGNESLLLRAIDQRRDQTYYLFGLRQDQLARTIMPLGDLLETNVVKMAKTFRLPVIKKSDLQSICFVDNTGGRDIVMERAPERYRPGGPIVDREGMTLGRHGGLFNYRIGQRRVVSGEKQEFANLCVIGFDLRINAVIVGDESELYQSALVATDCNWIGIQDFSRGVKATARIRANHHDAASCVITLLNNNSAMVEFEKPQLAITPGQAVVFYQEDIVVGGGWIDQLLNPLLTKLSRRTTFTLSDK